jgi:MoaA/NifB/PqqE/SkfB family radical SAM enzyme
MDWAIHGELELSITTYCQAKCPLCARTDRISGEKVSWLPLKHLPLESIKSSIDQYRNLNSKKTAIQICGDFGDPLMHPDIDAILAHCFENQHKVTVHTNGGLRSTEWYIETAKRFDGMLDMCFGIDGIDTVTNEKYRVGVDFEKAFSNMVAYGNNTTRYNSTKWDFLVFTYNYHQLEDAYQLSRQHNIQFRPKMNHRDWKYTVVDPEQLAGFRNFVQKVEYDYSM